MDVRATSRVDLGFSIETTLDHARVLIYDPGPLALPEILTVAPIVLALRSLGASCVFKALCPVCLMSHPSKKPVDIDPTRPSTPW